MGDATAGIRNLATSFDHRRGDLDQLISQLNAVLASLHDSTTFSTPELTQQYRDSHADIVDGLTRLREQLGAASTNLVAKADLYDQVEAVNSDPGR